MDEDKAEERRKRTSQEEIPRFHPKQIPSTYEMFPYYV
jgi:hypothetical protein